MNATLTDEQFAVLRDIGAAGTMGLIWKNALTFGVLPALEAAELVRRVEGWRVDPETDRSVWCWTVWITAAGQRLLDAVRFEATGPWIIRGAALYGKEPPDFQPGYGMQARASLTREDCRGGENCAHCPHPYVVETWRARRAPRSGVLRRVFVRETFGQAQEVAEDELRRYHAEATQGVAP